MSKISRWSYKNIATVWPFVRKDQLNGGTIWGAPYQIACTWTAETSVARDNDGKEFISRCTYFHEDQRVKHGDRILRGSSIAPDPVAAKAEEIRSHTNWDMSSMGEPESPDFKSIV